MNFLPTEEQRMAVEGFTRFLENKLRPIVQRYQPDKFIEKERMLEIFQMMLPYGMGGNGLISEENGGMGLPWLRRQWLHLGVRNQPAVPLHQNPRNRCGHLRGAQNDHRRGTAAQLIPYCIANNRARALPEAGRTTIP